MYALIGHGVEPHALKKVDEFAANAQSGRCEDDGVHFVVERVVQYFGDVQGRRKQARVTAIFSGWQFKPVNALFVFGMGQVIEGCEQVAAFLCAPVEFVDEFILVGKRVVGQVFEPIAQIF